MVQRRSFDKDYLNQKFEKVNAITERLALYLIGGGAMAFYGLKVESR